MNPDISEIISVSLRIVKYIMFYVPRTLKIEELFTIISQIKGAHRLFFDIHILKSANKIKALLIIFGYDIDKIICEKDITDYLEYIYENFHISEINIKIISTIAKIIGNYRFLENEINFRNSFKKELEENSSNENYNIGKELFNYFFKSVLTDCEKIKLKSLKIYSEYKSLNNKHINNIPHIKNKEIQITKIKKKDKKNKSKDKNINDTHNIKHDEDENDDLIEKYTVTYTGDNNDVYIAMKEDIKIEEEKAKIVQKDKHFAKIKKKVALKELFINDKKPQQLSNTTVSSSPSSVITSNNNNSIMSISIKNGQHHGDWNLASCHEISLDFIHI